MASQSTWSLTDLSDEVIVYILSFAKPLELLRLRRTCRRLRNLVSDQRVWENLLTEYGLRREQFWNDWSPEEMYQAIHPLRELLGFWNCELEQFGMLVNVVVDQSGIVAYDCLPPLDDSVLDLTSIRLTFNVINGTNYANVQRLHQFRFRRLFAFTPFVEENGLHSSRRFLRFICYHSPHCTQSSTAQQCDRSDRDEDSSQRTIGDVNGNCQKTENGFTLGCTNKAEEQPLDVQYWIEWEHGLRVKSGSESAVTTVLSSLRDEKDYDLRLEKFSAKASLHCFFLSRCMPYTVPDFGPPTRSLPTSSPLPMIDTGLYFGHFNWHGWEILEVSYTDQWTIIGEKVTGDQMIPVQKTSFRVDLRRRVQLNLEDQSTMATVRMAVKATTTAQAGPVAQGAGPQNDAAENGLHSSGALYPFRVPSDCAVLGTTSVPEHCLHCFIAEGQIAFPNYCNPRYLSCVCVVFSRVCIGLLWLDLKCFMPMYRALNS